MNFNKFITSIFADILNGIHFVVLGFLVISVFATFSNRNSPILEYLGEGFYGGIFGVLFVIFIFYILLVGFLTTIVSINENSVKMVGLLEQLINEKNTGSKIQGSSFPNNEPPTSGQTWGGTSGGGGSGSGNISEESKPPSLIIASEGYSNNANTNQPGFADAVLPNDAECPNCGALINSKDLQCSKCNTVFLINSNLHPIPISTVNLWENYEITFDGEKYHYKEFTYEKLEDAIRYAKLTIKRINK